MISVRHAPHRPTSNSVHGFRDIKHSTYSKRLFTGLGGVKKLNVRHLKPELDGFSFNGFNFRGGYLETKWLGKGLDNLALGTFEKLQSGGVLLGFVGNLLASAYRPMRFGIINKLASLLYQIVIKILTVIHNFIWRILFVPLVIIALVLITIIAIDFSFLFELIGQIISMIIGFFGSIFSGSSE